jgi:hypothetical protein
VTTEGPGHPHPTVEFIAREGMAERLLTDHRNDGTGRCRVCSSGPQAARKVWPCPLHEYARLATGQSR